MKYKNLVWNKRKKLRTEYVLQFNSLSGIKLVVVGKFGRKWFIKNEGRCRDFFAGEYLTSFKNWNEAKIYVEEILENFYKLLKIEFEEE
jgi:hypothetical protein